MGRQRTGTIDRVGDKHRVRLTLPDGRKPLGTFDTWDEAEGVRLAALEALTGREGGDVAILADWGEKWLRDREKHHKVRPKSSENDRSRWENHVLSHGIANMPLRAIRASDLDKLVTDLHEKKLSRQTIKHCLNIVHGMIKAGMRAGQVKLDPFAGGVPLPKDQRTTEPWTFAVPEEQDRIVGAAKGPERHLVAFTIATGLRAGELVALRLADTHDDRIVVRYGAAPAEPTKGNRVRTVHLNGRAKDALAAWLSALPSYTANKRYPDGRNPLGLTFPGRRGAFRNEEHVIRWAEWQGILKRAGITRPFRWHDLRHTCASSLVSGWWGRRWSLEEVREVLGHQDLKTTQRYAHLATDAIASAARDTPGSPAVIGQSIGQASGGVSNSLMISERDTSLELATFGLGSRRSTN
jgi:integrase